VVGVLQRQAEIRGLPKSVTIDNGPEFAGKVLDEWAYRHGLRLSFIQPGKPQQNRTPTSKASTGSFGMNA
jgi:putative transposase